MTSSDKRTAYKQLSEEEKKQHHIRSTFDSLVKVVPDLTESENRSEYAVLSKTSNYIRQLRVDNQRLLQIAKERGIEVPDDLKE
ncbi:uncharacterized protein OGAPODRAFT_92770 [Ogataea polymorpha]|uniref:uncharacterized protein n=1 Tax=Ogataea polymorpha TaxID=460523 RepID=UPI0007F3A540|nr:uncharacterized protein OGAPODRAFT_92770 [Ogataea polymorpha]OBA17497.1 hypothetical protein OGAPODRAFT_92770 [Ogataea polymorpha]